MADTITLIAGAHSDWHETDEAIGMMHSSVQIMRMALGPYLPQTAAAIRELGGLYEIRKEDPSDLDRAIHLYEEAIEAFRCNYGEQQYCS